MNATNPLSWPLKYKVELICKMEGYNAKMITQIHKWNCELEDLIEESDLEDSLKSKYSWELLLQREQLYAALKKIELDKGAYYEPA
jgi:hypothetical protein